MDLHGSISQLFKSKNALSHHEKAFIRCKELGIGINYIVVIYVDNAGL